MESLRYTDQLPTKIAIPPVKLNRQVVCIQGLALTLDMNLNYASPVLLTRAVRQVLTMYALFGAKLLDMP